MCYGIDAVIHLLGGLAIDRKDFVGPFLLLFSGTVAAQLINFASYPLLARIYPPSEFGIFATFVAATAIPGAIACGRFDVVVPTAPCYGRFAVLWLGYAFSVFVALLAALGALIYWESQAGQPAWELAILTGMTVALSGYVNATSMFLMRHDQYRGASSSVVMRTGVAVAVQICLGFVFTDSLALAIGFCAGLAAQAMHLSLYLARSVPIRRPKTRHMRALFRRFRRQVAIDVPSTLLAAVSLNMMPFFIQHLYGAAAVGFYSLGQRIAITPLQLFNDSLAQIFFQKAAKAQERTGTFWNELRFTLLVSGAVALLALVAIWLFVRPFVVVFLGGAWEPAGVMLVILAPMLAIRSVVMSIATAVFVLKRPAWLFYHNVASIIIMCLAFALALATKADIHAYLRYSAGLIGGEFLFFGGALCLAAYRQNQSAPEGARLRSIRETFFNRRRGGDS